MGALLYLTLCSLRNRTRVRLKRLKEPRYLIGTIAGLGYFWLVLWRPRSGGSSAAGSPGMIAAMGRARASIELFGALALFVVAALAWVWPGKNRPALAFTKADVQFLFPAPFTRKELIRYKVLRSQLGSFIGSAIMTLFFRPSSLASGGMFFLGMALTMTIINLHLTGVSLSRESLGEHGVAGLARQWLPLAVVLGAVAVLAGTVVMDWSVLSSFESGRDVVAELGRLADTGAAAVVLWPFRAVTRLPLAGTTEAFLQALPWTLLILALNYFWVLRSDARFEEASAELAEKVASLKKGGFKPSAPKVKAVSATPFTLALEGPAETAIFWKNLILLGRYASLKTLVRFIPLFAMFAFFLVRGGGKGGTAEMFGVFCTIVYFMTVIIGPQLARNDLRQDLAMLATLKTWPVRGAALVRGEVMAPAALLTSVAWICTIGGVMFVSRRQFEPAWIGAAAILAPGIILMQLLVQNLIAVVWPSWVMVGASRQRGIDVMGQRLIMMFGLLLVLAVAVLPAGLIGAGIGYAIYAMTGTMRIVIPALVAAIVLFAEAFVASEAIGGLLDRTDVSAIDSTSE